MIKKLLTTALVSSAFFMGAQSFTANYSFAAVTTTTGLVDPTPTPTATGVSFGSFSAAGTGTVTNPNAGGRFSFINWSVGSTSLTASTYSLMTGSLDTAKYYKVSLTPSAGYFVSLTNISFKVQRSGTGIRSYAVRSSANSYTANLPASVGTSTVLSIQSINEFFWNSDVNASAIGSEINLGGPSYTGFSSPMTFKFYGWNAEASGGTFSIDSVTFSGSVSLATGIGSVNFDLNSNFNVYPVPCNDGVIFIENKHAIEVSKIELMDVLGNVVLSNQATNESKIKLNLADLPSGNYFVKMSSGKQVSVKKIVVIK